MGNVNTLDRALLSPDLRQRLEAYDTIRTIGDPSLLSGETLGLLCSRQCPGSVILKFFDLLSEWKKAEITVISGFHSPLEQETLKSLRSSNTKFIVCPARSIENMKIPKEWGKLIDNGRMLILSPFAAKEKRQSATLAAERNLFVSRIANQLLIVHASKGSQLEQLAKTVDKFLTIDCPENENLLQLGGGPWNSTPSSPTSTA
jgi:predicted Rossmann fold nucleotide-binding protein DprA/Smf involved in DNA uptake